MDTPHRPERENKFASVLSRIRSKKPDPRSLGEDHDSPASPGEDHDSPASPAAVAKRPAKPPAKRNRTPREFDEVYGCHMA